MNRQALPSFSNIIGVDFFEMAIRAYNYIEATVSDMQIKLMDFLTILLIMPLLFFSSRIKNGFEY